MTDHLLYDLQVNDDYSNFSVVQFKETAVRKIDWRKALSLNRLNNWDGSISILKFKTSFSIRHIYYYTKCIFKVRKQKINVRLYYSICKFDYPSF